MFLRRPLYTSLLFMLFSSLINVLRNDSPAFYSPFPSSLTSCLSFTLPLLLSGGGMWSFSIPASYGDFRQWAIYFYPHSPHKQQSDTQHIVFFTSVSLFCFLTTCCCYANLQFLLSWLQFSFILVHKTIKIFRMYLKKGLLTNLFFNIWANILLKMSPIPSKSQVLIVCSCNSIASRQTSYDYGCRVLENSSPSDICLLSSFLCSYTDCQ